MCRGQGEGRQRGDQLPLNRKVLFITQTAYPWGGVESWLRDLANALERRQWDVTVGLVRGKRFHKPELYLRLNPFRKTVEVDAPTGTHEGRVRALIRAIRQVNPDIVVPINIADALEAVRRLKLKGHRLRLLYAAHGLCPHYFLDVRMYRWIIDYAVSVNRLGALTLNAICCVPNQRTEVIPSGVPAPFRIPDFEERSGILRVAYVGRLTNELKRTRDLVPLCEALDRRRVAYRLEIAGTGAEEMFLREKLNSRVEAKRVFFNGQLCTRDLYQRVYPGLEVLLLLSESETGPMAAWEAMRHGATVVTTRYRGLSAEGVLRHGVNVLISEIGDVNGLAHSLERLGRDRSLLCDLRKEAFRTAEKFFDVRQSTSRWEAAFQTCLHLPIATGAGRSAIFRKSGRLDYILGQRWGETVRRKLRRGMVHQDPGGEWPDSFYLNAPDCKEVEVILGDLDRPQLDTAVQPAGYMEVPSPPNLNISCGRWD